MNFGITPHFLRNSIVPIFLSFILYFDSFSQSTPTSHEFRALHSRDVSQIQSSKTNNQLEEGSRNINQSGDYSFSIPLQEISGRKLHFPLTANYQSGIKVEQKSSEIGLGWSLSFGSIQRDYGAFEPDYSTTVSEAKMINSSANCGNSECLNIQNETFRDVNDNSKSLEYIGMDHNGPSSLTPDLYRLNVPGLGSNSFWNQGDEDDDSPTFGWTEVTPWKIEYETETFTIHQELSRINEINYHRINNNNKLSNNSNYAFALGVLPYVKNRKLEELANPFISTSNISIDTNDRMIVEYEDYSSFTITTPNGTQYIFGRPLRAQKYMMSEDPFWSTISSVDQGSLIPGEWWKVDYISEWLLTEIRSVDYRDVNGNGPDNADEGDWIIIEYNDQWRYENVQGVHYSKIRVPKYREWLNFSSTDRHSSLWKELAYVEKIESTTQKVIFDREDKPLEIDHDYFNTVFNNPENLNSSTQFVYNSATIGQYNNGFKIRYPWEKQRYTSIEVYDKNNTDQTIIRNNKHKVIEFDYATTGSSDELAVSKYLIRSNDDEQIVSIDPHDIVIPDFNPNNPGAFDIEDFNALTNNSYAPYKMGRGKMTLLGISFSIHDEFTSLTDEREYSFEYNYNPSFSGIHKKEIRKLFSFPSIRQSTFSEGGTTPFPRKNPTQSLYPDVGLRLFESYRYQNGQIIYEDLGTAFIDEMGYYYNNNDPLNGRHAWSLSKVTYPSGLEESLEYERDKFDINNDRQGWNSVNGILDNQIPYISYYNNVAIARTALQESIDNHPNNNNPAGSAKKPYNAFHNPLNTYSGGLRIKKITLDGKYDTPKVIQYNYGNGHYPYLPNDYVSNHLAAFSEFMLREKSMQEGSNAYNSLFMLDVESFQGMGNDFNRFMSRLSIPTRVGINVDNEHYYESIEEITVNPGGSNSKVVRYYGDINTGTPSYIQLTNLWLKGTDRDWRPLVEGLLCDYDDSKKPRLWREELYKESGNNYNLVERKTFSSSRETAATNSVKFKSNSLDETEYFVYFKDGPNCSGLRWAGASVCNNTLVFQSSLTLTTSNQSWSLTVYPPDFRTFTQGIYDDIVQNSLASNSIKDGQYNISGKTFKRLQSNITKDQEVKIFKGGATTSTKSHFNDWGQIVKECQEGSTITENGNNNLKVNCTYYEYAWENPSLYISSYNWLYTKGILGLVEESRTSFEDIPFEGVHFGSSLPTNGVFKASAIDYEYETNNQVNIREEGSYFYEDALLNNGSFNSPSTFNNTTPNSPWNYDTKKTEYDRYGNRVFDFNNEIYNRNVLGYNSTQIKASISHPKIWFDATYTGYEDHFYDWGEKSFLEEKEQEFWYDKNITRGTGANPNVVKNSQPTKLRKRTGRYSYQLQRQSSTITNPESTPIRFIEVQPLSNSFSCPAPYPSGRQWSYSGSNGGCRFDYTASAWITRGILQAIESQNEGLMMPFFNPENDPTGIDLYRILADGRKSSAAKMDALSPYYPLSDPLLLSVLSPSSGLEATDIETVMNNHEKLSNQVLLEIWNQRTTFSSEELFNMFIKPKQYPNDELLIKMLEGFTSDWEPFFDQLLGASPWPASQAVQDAASSHQLELPEGWNSDKLKWVYKIWSEDLNTLYYWGEKPIQNVTNEWKYYEIDIPIHKHSTEKTMLEVYITDERSPHSSSYYTNGGGSIGAYDNFLKQTCSFIDDMIIYPMDGKYDYYSFDWKGNPINYTNSNDDFLSTTYDRLGRTIHQYDFEDRMVSTADYFHSNNLNQVMHRNKVRRLINGTKYSEDISYADGFGHELQHLHNRSQQFGAYAIDSKRDVFGRPTWVSKPFAIPFIGSPTPNPQASSSYLNNQWGFNDAGITNDYELPFNDKEGRFYQATLPIESDIVTEVSRSENLSTSLSYTSYNGTNKSFPQGALYMKRVTDPEGVVISQLFDRFNNLIADIPSSTHEYNFDNDGDINWSNSQVPTPSMRYDYDNSNKLRKIIDRKGLETFYSYDARGNIIKEVHPDRGTNEYRYDRLGRLRFSKSNRDQSGNLTAGISEQFTYLKYDDWNRLIEIGTIEFTSGSSHFDDPNLIDNPNWPYTSTTRRKVFVNYEYDGEKAINGQSRLMKVTSFNEHYLNGSIYFPGKTDIEEYEYDNNGNQIKNTYKFDEFTGNHTVEWKYNRSGLIEEKRYIHPSNPDYNFAEKYEYNGDGKILTSKSSTGNSSFKLDSKFTYDIYGHLIRRSLGEIGNSFAEDILYSLNIREQPTYLNGSKFYHHLKFDKRGNIDEQTWLNDQFDNLSGNPTQTHKYDYFYDELNRLVGANYIEQSTAQPVNSGYSAMIAENPNGEAVNCGFESALLMEMEYDNISNDVNTYMSLLNDLELQYGYSSDKVNSAEEQFTQAMETIENLDSRKTDDPSDIVYATFEQLSNIQSAIEIIDEDIAQVNFLLSPFFQIESNSNEVDIMLNDYELQFSNLEGINLSKFEARAFQIAIDLRSELNTILNNEELSTDDKITNITAVISIIDEANSDLLSLNDRLSQFSGDNLTCILNNSFNAYTGTEPDPVPLSSPPDQRYDTEYYYDFSGNITEINRVNDQSIHTNYKFNYNSNNNFKTLSLKNISGSGTTSGSFNYDANGNITMGDHINISSSTYTPFNMPTSTVMQGGLVDSYRYFDKTIRNVKETSNGAKEYYLNGVVLDINERPKNIQITDGFITFHPTTAHTNRYYTAKDWLGTIRVTMDEAGAIVSTRDHYPFGKQMPGRLFSSDDEDRRYQFTGHEFDEETDLGYHGARYYSRELGQYLSTDPLAHMRSWVNPYNFVQNNPIMRTDPTGALDTRYEDEAGNILAETDDGSDDVVTITDDKLDGFKASYKGTSEEMRNSADMNETWKAYSGYNIKSDKLDPSTLNQNIFNQHYPGGNNPQTYPDAKGNTKPHYGTPPVNLAGYPAVIHDKSYDNLEINGASGLLTDTRAIGADYRFVKNEFTMGNISMMTGDYSTAIKSYGLGFGLGVLALPKTIYKLSQPTGLLQIKMWDAASQPTK